MPVPTMRTSSSTGHCGSAGTSTAYPAAGYTYPTYVQQDQYQNPSDPLGGFDDLVTYKERWQLQGPFEQMAITPPTHTVYFTTNNATIGSLTTQGTYSIVLATVRQVIAATAA
jgi:hypothetical protein